MPRVGIITSKNGWHSRQIASALTARGCDVYFAALTDFELLVTQGRSERCGFFHNRLPSRLPDAVFVRCIPAGTLEQIVFYLDILYTFELQSVLVYNNARTIERSVDKVMTTFLLRQAGLPTPRTWAGLNMERAQTVIEQQTQAGRALVMKPIFGAQGKGLQYIDAKSPPEFAEGTVYYLQEFIGRSDKQWCDWRLFVVNHQVVATMKRIGKSWINNVAQGSICRVAEPDASMVALAEAASVVVGTSYAGVDIIADAAGNYQIIEINSIPAWQGLQSVVSVSVADLVAKDLLCRLPNRSPQDCDDAGTD